MVDTNEYIVIEKRTYPTLEEAIQQIRDCYSDLPGVIAFLDDGKWVLLRNKKSIE